MRHFIKINTADELPIFSEVDANMIKKMIPFCKKVIEWNKRPENKNETNSRHGLIALMIKAGSDEKEIVNIFINLIVAGGETPALVCCA